MDTNRTYKASVFTLLFSDPSRLRELYNALPGAHAGEPAVITINTLCDAIFMDRINDLSFTVNGKQVILIEHQSTINPNMALRLLLYIARIYEKIIDTSKIYTGKKLIVPRPECIVLYNGTAEYPAESRMKLSEHFEVVEGQSGTDLELTVKVYNINKGCNEKLERRSRTLAGYAAFVAKVREEEAAGKGQAAVKAAVKWCIREGHLVEFLKEHGSEVENMLFVEWNWDDALAVRYAEGREDGFEKGMEEGKQQERGIAQEEAKRQQRETARKLKTGGVELALIANSTGLTRQEIAAL
jgi:predicted transposase/invertase (TIGR01784 family)